MKLTIDLNLIKTTIVSLALMCATSASHAAIISSTFDIDDEGWKVSGDTTSSSPNYFYSTSNANGYILANDQGLGGVWYFNAPSKFLGDQSGAFGQTLSFDLNQTGSGSQFNSRDVILNGGGLEIWLDAGDNPLPLGEWISYSVSITEDSGWMLGNSVASASDIQTVLGSLQSLRIRGEFIDGNDTGRLDNVELSVVPIPAAAWLFITGLIGMIGISRRNNYTQLIKRLFY